MSARHRKLLAGLALFVLAPLLAAVIIAVLLLFGVEPQAVFLPGRFVMGRLEGLGFQVHNRVGVLTTVAFFWAVIVGVWLLVRRSRATT